MKLEQLPKVSCIVPTYNREPMLLNSIRMFQEQTHPNREMVIVDDSDPVMSQKIMKVIREDPNIRYIRLRTRKSIGHKRNVAVKEARGKYIAFWDDDDIQGPDRLLNQARRMEAVRCDVCTNGRHIYYRTDTRQFHTIKSKPELQEQLWWKRMLMPSLMFKKSLIKYARFPNRYISEDKAFFRDVMRRYPRCLRIDLWEEAPACDFAYVLHPKNTAWSNLATQMISVTKPYSRHSLCVR